MPVNNEELRAALLASGVDPEAEEVLETPEPSEEEPETPEETAEATPPAETPVEGASGQSELRELLRENVKLENQVESLEARLAEIQATQEVACNVVRRAVSRLAVGCQSGQVIGLETADLNTLCNHFNTLNAEFERRYPAKGVSKPTTAVQVTEVDRERERRLALAKKTRK